MSEMETTRNFICDVCTGVLWLAATGGRTASASGVEPLLTGVPSDGSKDSQDSLWGGRRRGNVLLRMKLLNRDSKCSMFELLALVGRIVGFRLSESRRQ
jgi:hypothetical protein